MTVAEERRYRFRHNTFRRNELFTPEIESEEDKRQLKKHRYNAFHETDLDLELHNRDSETLIVVGCVTNQCCESTDKVIDRLE